MSAPGPANLNTAKGILAKVGLRDGDYTIDQLDMGQHINAMKAGTFDGGYTLASWGVRKIDIVPDHFRLDRSGQVLERKAGRKRIAIRALPNGQRWLPLEKRSRSLSNQSAAMMKTGRDTSRPWDCMTLGRRWCRGNQLVWPMIAH